MKSTFKTTLATLTFVALATQLFAQGTVVFQNRVPGILNSPIYYNPDSYTPLHGNGPDGIPPGTQNWSGYGRAAGSSFLAALLAAPGSINSFVSAQFGSLVVPFGTGADAGFVQGGICTLPGLPKDAPLATMLLFAWDNSSGLFSDPVRAWTAVSSGVIGGMSGSPFTIQNIGGDLNSPPYLTGLVSFNILPVPEPSAAALLVLGAAAWGWRRRSSQG
jgi:hypothetical protein